MKQREVQGDDNVRWTCVQALGGVESKVADEAAEKVQAADGTVPVVCTPSGGAETLRLALPAGWEEEMSDEQLVAAIAAAS